jgi:hypothetical protein
MNQVDLGEFIAFTKDFQVALPKSKITEVFKKCSVSHRPHKLPQFASAIDRLGQEIHN